MMDEQTAKEWRVSNGLSRVLEPDNKLASLFVDGEPDPWVRADLPLKEAR